MVLVLIFTASLSFAKRLVVPDNYRTIQNAIQEADEGDTVFVKKGTYKENIVLQDGVVLLGEKADNTILRGDRRRPVVTAANNAVIMNFTILNGGIGIVSENTNVRIERNIIRENERSGIQCLISLPYIRNNIIAGNEWTGIYCELISYGMRTAVEHNIIAENGNSGVMLSNKCVVLIQNNVFYKNKQFGIHVTESSRKSRIVYNDLFENRRSFSTYAIVDETNVDKDPQFPPLAWTSFEFLSSYDSPLRGLGRDGSTIGLIREEEAKTIQADSDNDGIPDDTDNCKDISEDFDGFEDKDGCPDYDNDFDGLYDKQDNCPHEAEDFDGFDDKDGCPDPDNDNDGIADTQDKCPNRAETINEYKDDDGCPDEKPE